MSVAGEMDKVREAAEREGVETSDVSFNKITELAEAIVKDPAVGATLTALLSEEMDEFNGTFGELEAKVDTHQQALVKLTEALTHIVNLFDVADVQFEDDDADLKRAHENFERVWRVIDDINNRLLKLERGVQPAEQFVP
jgi:chromosome segregation ATPase